MSICTPVVIAAGRVLARQGAVGREFMVIERGTATVRRDDAVIALLGPGDFFGEVALVTGAPRTATVTADSDMTLHVFGRGEFSTLLDAVPSLGRVVGCGPCDRWR